MVQASTEFNEGATIVSVDGVGAYDLVSRTAMLSGLMDMEEGDRDCCHLSVCSFLIRPRSCGMTKLEIRQGEGGEQGDALMPLLFSLGQHGALKAVARGLEEGISGRSVRDLPTRQSASSPPKRGAGVV